MTKKRISIDLEAYRRLKHAQIPGETLSQTIKRIIRLPFDFNRWIKRIEANPVSDAFANAVEEHIARRRRKSKRER